MSPLPNTFHAKVRTMQNVVSYETEAWYGGAEGGGENFKRLMSVC